MPNYPKLWVEDCDSATLAHKLTTFCHQTGERAGEDPVCGCLVHKALRSDAAEQAKRNAMAELDKNQVELRAALADLADARKQVAFYDARVVSLTKELAKAAQDAAESKAQAKAAFEGAQAFKQSAADFEAKAQDAENRAANAEKALAKFKAVLAGLQ